MIESIVKASLKRWWWRVRFAWRGHLRTDWGFDLWWEMSAGSHDSHVEFGLYDPDDQVTEELDALCM